MSPDKSDVPNTVAVIEFDYQSILVAGNVEYDSIVSQYARVAVHGFDPVRCRPVRRFGFLIPGFDWFFSVRVNLPEVTQGADSDDPHQNSLSCSHIGNNRLIQ